MRRQSIHFIVLFLYSNYTVRYQIIASKENSPYHQKNFCFFIKPNSFLIDKISCQGVKKLASTREKTKFLVISLRMQVFPITTIRFKNPAKISRFVYSTQSPFNACADKCPLCSLALNRGDFCRRCTKITLAHGFVLRILFILFDVKIFEGY